MNIFSVIRNTSIRYIASFHLATDLIPAACDTVVFCIQQQGENEEAARKEASDWAKEILTTSGEYLNVRCRKQVNIILLKLFSFKSFLLILYFIW